MTTQTTTQDWTAIISNRSAARQAARTEQTFQTPSGWFIIESGIATQADAEQAEVIEAEMARMAAMFAEFGTEGTFEADAEAQAQAFSAEATARWMADSRNGFGSF
jgi:hypothetical protein